MTLRDNNEYRTEHTFTYPGDLATANETLAAALAEALTMLEGYAAHSPTVRRLRQVLEDYNNG